MGWLYIKSLKGHSGPRQYLDAQFTYEGPGAISKVLRSALVGIRVYYGAVEQLRIATGQREVWAAICLVRYNPRDREAVGFAWEYLRRNPDYQRAYLESSDATTTFGHELLTPLRYWGLSFLGRSRAFSHRASRILVVVGCAGCRPPCPGSC